MRNCEKRVEAASKIHIEAVIDFVVEINERRIHPGEAAFAINQYFEKIKLEAFKCLVYRMVEEADLENTLPNEINITKIVDRGSEC